MWEAFDKINHFTLRGAGWGLLLGGLSGTLMLPILGTLIAGFWGGGIGLALGFIIGILMALSDVLFLSDNTDRRLYRRKWAAVSGSLTAIGALALLIVTTHGLLWSVHFYPMTAQDFLIPSIIATAIWGCLAAAYTTTRHIDQENHQVSQNRIDSSWVIERLMKTAFNRWTFIIGMTAGAVFNLVQELTYPFRFTSFAIVDAGRFLLIGAAGGAFLTIVNILLLGLANGFLLLFLNGLYFKEYAAHLTLAEYKKRISVIVFLFTLFAGLLVSAFVFAPVSAVIATLAARSYADWLYDGEEKFKRKAKTDYALLESPDEPAEDIILLETALPEKAHQH